MERLADEVDVEPEEEDTVDKALGKGDAEREAGSGTDEGSGRKDGVLLATTVGVALMSVNTELVDEDADMVESGGLVPVEVAVELGATVDDLDDNLSFTLRGSRFSSEIEGCSAACLSLCLDLLPTAPFAIALRSFFFSLSLSFIASCSCSFRVAAEIVSPGVSRTKGNPVCGPLKFRMEEKCSQS